MLAVQCLATGIRALGTGTQDTERRTAGALSSGGGAQHGDRVSETRQGTGQEVWDHALCVQVTQLKETEQGMALLPQPAQVSALLSVGPERQCNS